MAKRKKSTRTASRSKSKSFSYRPETYGIKHNSLTFLLFSLFVLVASVLLVSSMLGVNLY